MCGCERRVENHQTCRPLYAAPALPQVAAVLVGARTRGIVGLGTGPRNATGEDRTSYWGFLEAEAAVSKLPSR